MKAYMKDIQQNPDMTSHNIIEKAKAQNIPMPKIVPEKPKTQWHEAKTSDGEVYYWHAVTGGTITAATFHFFKTVSFFFINRGNN